MRDFNLVSVIIPTYKRPELLLRAVNSLRNQTYKNIEVVIVNDNGEENPSERDETRKVVKELEQELNILYIELEHNIGGAKARNAGIYQSNGYYISFLDDDDIYLPEKLSEQVEFFSKSKSDNIAFVKCEMFYVSENRTTTTHVHFQDNLLHRHIIDQHGIVGTGTYLFRKDILKEIGGFPDTSIRQEYCLLLNLFLAGYTGLAEDKVLVHFVGDDEGITTTRSEKKAQDMTKIYEYRVELAKKENIDDKELAYMEKRYLLDMLAWYTSYKTDKALHYYYRLLKNGHFTIYSAFWELAATILRSEKFKL